MIFFALSFLLSLLLCINVCWSHIPRGRDGHGNRDVAKLSIKSKRLLWMLTLSSVKIRFKLSDCNALWRIWPWPCLPPLPDDSYLKYAAWITPKMHLGLTYTHQEVIKNCHRSAFMIFFSAAHLSVWSHGPAQEHFTKCWEISMDILCWCHKIACHKLQTLIQWWLVNRIAKCIKDKVNTTHPESPLRATFTWIEGDHAGVVTKNSGRG